MKDLRYLLILFSVCLPHMLFAQQFEKFFCDSTLRLDYIFAGTADKQNIYLSELTKEPRWYGSRHHLSELPLLGNGQITVRDEKTQEVIYRHSFSTLFQEWLSSKEATQTSKSFENVLLIPYPKAPVNIHVQLTDYHLNVITSMEHRVDPKDILIRSLGFHNVTPYSTLQQAKDSAHCIHIAYVAEGYTAEQMDTFLADCRSSMNALFDHEPFKQLRDKFQIVAVMSPSAESGTSIPHDGKWVNTLLGSHYDTFYSERYLTTVRMNKLHDALAGTPYEHIIILVNTANYGGGGVYNSYEMCATHGENFHSVIVHEFGHSFGGLGDEYAYDSYDNPMYFSDTEPWEPNLTTKHDFSHKWGNLIKAGKAGMYEGGGYMSKGVFRGCKDCRMNTNACPEFCSVCQQALTRLINFYTE